MSTIERDEGSGLDLPPPRSGTIATVGEGDHRDAMLEAAGHRVRRVGWHELDRLGAQDADVVVVATGPEEPAAPAVVRALRARHEGPVLVLLEGSTETDRVRVLRAGADDCVDRVGDGELLARVEALLRRVRPSRVTAPLGLEIDEATRTALVAGRELDLTRREFDLLARLAASPHRVLDRRQLLLEVWPTGDDAPGGATVTEHVRRLRRKLRDAGAPEDAIETIRGVGYRLVPERCEVIDLSEGRDRRRRRRRRTDRDAGAPEGSDRQPGVESERTPATAGSA